jgi:hypothetical protein
MKSAHGPLARNSLRAPGSEAARSRNRPRARLPSDNVHRARPPCGPRRKSAHRLARARHIPRSRPQPGPGPGKSHPAWAESRFGECEPFISIQRLREVFSRTKPASAPSRKPLPHFSPPLPLARRSERHERSTSGGGESEPEAPPEPSPVCALTVG